MPSGTRLTPSSYNKKNKNPPWTIIPLMLWLLFFLTIPLCIVIGFSFMHKGDYGKIEYHFEIRNYLRTLEPLFLRIFSRSVWLAFFTTFCCLILAFPFAYYMARAKKNLRKILLGLVIVPFWTNFVIRIYALKLVLGETGILNNFLMKLSLIDTPLILTNNLLGTYIGMVYNYFPFMVLPLYVCLEKFDFTLLDASYDLGANRFQTATKVLFPLSLQGVLTGCLFVFIPAFGEFAIPELLGGSQLMYVGNLITETFLRSRDWPFGSAISSFLVLMTMIAFLLFHSRSSKESDHV